VPDRPLAYFITFRTYGTWLQGDARGWTARGDARGELQRAPHRGFAGNGRQRMRDEPFVLNQEARGVVERAIRATCSFRDWDVVALNVRTNHVHVVLAAGEQKPEPVMTTLKTWASRALRGGGLAGPDRKLWSRHGSTEYLWTERDVQATAWYVVHGQDGPRD
jgi:REP element-mobilizing transposase RayT